MISNILINDQNSFTAWLAKMNSALSEFFAIVGPEIATRLTFDVDSLDAMESWLLKNFSDYKELRLSSNFAVYDGAARYLGEVLRRAVGGDWIASLDDPRSSFYGFPAVDNYPGRTILFMPHFKITATIDRKKGNYLSSHITNIQKRCLEAKPMK